MNALPGTKTAHAIITDQIRESRGDEAALEDALHKLRVSYRQMVRGWKVGDGAVIHLAMSVKRSSAHPEPVEDGHGTKEPGGV